MPIKETNNELWRKSRLNTGFQCPLTKEFFSTQSDLDLRVSEYNSSIWKPRHILDGKSTSWANANMAETKALDIIRDKFHSTLTHHIVNKAHQSVRPLNDLVEVISKNCAVFIKGEQVKMENGDDIILSCKVVKVHSDDSSYTINDGTRDILRVPSIHLSRPHQLTSFDIESLIRLTCTQSEKDHSWQVEEEYKKEFGMKERLAPIFCKPQNGTKKIAASSEEDEVIVLPPVKKAKRESNDSLKENGEKKEVKKERKPRKRKEDNGEKDKVEKKKAKKETKQEVVNLDSTDDEAPLSVIADKMKNKNQKQGFLDKFLTASPSSSKGSPTKKRKGKVQKALEPLIVLYEKEDIAAFLHECDIMSKLLTKEIMDTRMENIKTLEDIEKSVEAEIIHILHWRRQFHSLNSNVLKLSKEERAAARERNKKELDMMQGKILFDKRRETIKTAKAIKDMEEDERYDYDSSMGKLSPSGDLITSPHFSIALMISEFIYTRSNLFPLNYRLPMTEEIDDALNAQGKEKIIKSRKVTYPIIKILMEMMMEDATLQKRFVFCNTSISKLKLDEYSVIEMIRSILIGEKAATKEERQKWRLEKGEVKEDEEDEMKDDEDRPPSPDETENDEDERDGDITMNEDDRLELVGALENCNGRWEEIDGKNQGAIIEFILNQYIDSDQFAIKKDVELQEENDELKREKKEITKKMDETKGELTELQNSLKRKEDAGLRLARSETGKIMELEEVMVKNGGKLDEIMILMKNLEKELDLSKYISRLDPIGIDRHGRRYMMMPHYAGLLIQSIGSEEWIKDQDGNEYFGFIPFNESWRRVISVTEWDELSEKLKNGSRKERKLSKSMEKNKDKFENGIKWIKKVEENKLKDVNDEDEKMEEQLNEIEGVRTEMIKLLEKSENGELLKVKDISLFHKKAKDADSLANWRSLLLEFEDTMKKRAMEEGSILLRLYRMMDETQIAHSIDGWRKRVEGARLSELLMLIRVLDYRIVWNHKELAREKEDKKKDMEDKKKQDEIDEEDNEWKERGVHTRRYASRKEESKDTKEVRALMKKVISMASGRLLSTLNTLECDDERMMNLKDIEEECHRWPLDRLKKVLRKNLQKWRDEIETRFAHRIVQFDEFADAVYELV